MSKKRQANLELLRIISMLLIITLHFLGHGGVLQSVTPDTVQFYLDWFIDALATVAVNCYVLISGYFLIESKFRLKKLIALWGHVFFYSIAIYVVLVCTGQIAFNVRDLAVSLFPVLTVQYWFVSMYIGMYVLSPFLNVAIKGMDQKKHFICIIVLDILFSVWSTICPFSTTLNFGDGMGIVWFIVLYFVAAYLRLYYQPNYRPKKYLGIYFGLAGLIACSKYFFTMVYELTGLSIVVRGSSVFYNYNSILVYLASVALFITFLNIRIKERKGTELILRLAPLTFAIYLIHDNNFIRSVLWEHINASTYSYEWYFPFFMIGVITGIYIICSLIEKLRSVLFKVINTSVWLDEKCTQINEKFLSHVNNILTK